MRNLRTRLLAIAGAAFVLSLSACDGDSSPHTGDVGAVRMALDIAPGTTINTISYVVQGPQTFMRAGSIDVSHSSTISADLSPLPAGTGFTITLSATSVTGSAMCLGSAMFDVSAHQTTSVVVHLLCRQPSQNGSVMFSGALNLCPTIDSLGASPDEVTVGGALVLSAQAHDGDNGPAPLTYQWATTSGTLSSSSAQNPTLTCTSSGPATVTLTVSDGDTGAGCPDVQSLTVICSGGV
jgi:hypothetical protein